MYCRSFLSSSNCGKAYCRFGQSCIVTSLLKGVVPDRESHCTVSCLAITNRLSLKFLHLNYHSWIIIWVAHCVLRALGFPALSWSQITVYVEFQLFFLCLHGFPSGDVVSSPYPQNFVLFYVSFIRYWKEPVIFQYALQHSHYGASLLMPQHWAVQQHQHGPV